jgi:hypothetical protein
MKLKSIVSIIALWACPLIAEVQIDPTFREFQQAGGGNAILTSGSGTWTATTSAPWISLVSGYENGIAGGLVTYLVSANLSADVRTGTILVDDKVHTIHQLGYPATISPSSKQLSASGGAATVEVQPQGIVAWSATPDVPWIKVVSGSSGFGNGSVELSIAGNNSVNARSGSVTIAGQTFTVNQSGLPLVLDPSTKKLDSTSTSIVIVSVSALSGVTWDPIPQDAWISVIDPGTKSGSSQVTFAVSENQSFLERTGTVDFGQATLTIVQPGVDTPEIFVSPLQTTAAPSGASGSIRKPLPVDYDCRRVWAHLANGCSIWSRSKYHQ